VSVPIKCEVDVIIMRPTNPAGSVEA